MRRASCVVGPHLSRFRSDQRQRRRHRRIRQRTTFHRHRPDRRHSSRDQAGKDPMLPSQPKGIRCGRGSQGFRRRGPSKCRRLYLRYGSRRGGRPPSSRDAAMFGILLIDKPLGCTSHDVVNDMRRRFQTKRVGHAGTLDPLATGLLVVAVGPATRFLQYLPLEPKEYDAEITFGKSTTTFDREGDITSEAAVPADLDDVIQAVLPSFLGLIQQTPPMFSAVKIGGKALYKYARAGEEVLREPRNVHIGEFQILNVQDDKIRARIVCSGGTYIRTLAHDLGQAVGCGAYLSDLNRTRVGRFDLSQAVPLKEASPAHLLPLA